MYSCPTCGKTYSTQSSLTRHSHNHKRSKEHVCSVCEVIFYRKDLLVRHSKMHSAEEGLAAAQRLRTHTACTSCREARMKCDGGRPCTACRRAFQACSYTAGGGRISTHTQSRSEGEVNDYDQLNEPASATASASGQSMEQATLVWPAQDIALPQMPTFGSPPLGFEDTTSLSPFQMTAWPWLHESMFLQNVPNADWFTTWSTDPLDEQMMMETTQRNLPVVDIQMAAIQGSDTTEILPNPRPIQTDLSMQNNGRSQATAPRTIIPSSPELQNRLIEELVTQAHHGAMQTRPGSFAYAYWKEVSPQVQEIFGLDNSQTDWLEHFVDLYWANFLTLWPFFSQHAFNVQDTHPILFLAIVQIGAMYGSKNSSFFATVLHQRLRDFLAAPLFNLEIVEADSVALAQARALTQAAALYFGHSRSFTYAQHLGSVLVAQARRMNLFSESREMKALAIDEEQPNDCPEAKRWLDRWLLLESRKRLTYAILRLEMYASILLNCRPLLSSEEIQLELPCPSFLWQTKFSSDASLIDAIRQEMKFPRTEKILYCDLVWIAIETRESMLPIDLGAQEMLLFGLQEHVWRVCHEIPSLRRLLGSNEDPSMLDNDGLDLNEPASSDDDDSDDNDQDPVPHRLKRTKHRTSSSLPSDPLLSRSRRMRRMHLSRESTTSALRNWKKSLSLSSNAQLSLGDRSSLMSCFLLYHLSYMRMFAPVEKLHYISYRLEDESFDADEALRGIAEWAQSRRATVAVEHACIVFELLRCEVKRPAQEQARFNFLAMLGLHHATVLVWTYAGTHETELTVALESGAPSLGRTFDSSYALPVIRAKSGELMTEFVRLFDRISPAWSVRSSFSAAAARLASIELPT